MEDWNSAVKESMKVRIDDELPPPAQFDPSVLRAPSRGFRLSSDQAATALRNALRYVPEAHHAVLAPEFMNELVTRGRIYAYRYRPQGRIWGRPISEYTGKCLEGQGLQVMIDNNLDFEVAQYPYELVTYGETGSVFHDWLQYRLAMKYLQELTEEQTLVISSGHPLGLFRSSRHAPRVTNTNGLLVGMYDNLGDWEIAAEMGVTNYGQMTAGGWFFIGPQGIIHGCYNMLRNAARKRGIAPGRDDLRGVLYVTAGLGSISSAQAKASQIAKCVGVIAEVNLSLIEHRARQRWVDWVSDDLDAVIARIRENLSAESGITIAYHGNTVDLLERIDALGLPVDILSDQTSCHIPYDGGYTPQGLTYEQGRRLLETDRDTFRTAVDKSLRRHYALVKSIAARGAFFLEYGNSLMLAMYNAGVTEIARNRHDIKDGFRWPDFIEAVTGPELFDYGYGPFRWVCLSGKMEDLGKTDRAAMECIDPDRRPQDRDNYNWIRHAGENDLIVGTQARLVYQDRLGRTRIARRFNEMVRNGEVGPIMIGRDHHDTGGADCPIRETSNVRDGSNVTADMAAQCYVGDAVRGMSFVSMHNGGGTGIGRSIHAGFALLLDGSDRVDSIIDEGVNWDVMGGVARRSWARNPNSMKVALDHVRTTSDAITLPYLADDDLVLHAVDEALRP
jgi:urocanate hydratase